MDTLQMESKLEEFRQRYVRRTVDEIAQMKALMVQGRAGVPEALREIEVISHRIHGSGSMFKFDGIGDAAGRLEGLIATWRAADAAIDDELLTHCETALHEIEAATKAVVESR